MNRSPRKAIVSTAALVAVLLAVPSRANVTADRTAVRFVSPETGGVASPRFLTERELAFFTRIEALFEQSPVEASAYPERYVRMAVDRLVARTMLASLMLQKGVEPPELPRQTQEARAELEERLGGAKVLAEAMHKEGIEEADLLSFLRDQVRASYYVDRMISPILAVSEDALRAAFRSMVHPFRNEKFEAARGKLRRWLVVERFRAAELEFLLGARARVKVTPIRPGDEGKPTP